MPERPTGTVTFLFTDIEGSTRLLQQLRERYDVVQSRHAEIFRAVFAAHDGHEIDTQGDAFFAAFGRARDAVAAAVEAQRALAAEDWPEGSTVRVSSPSGWAARSTSRYTGSTSARFAYATRAARSGVIPEHSPRRECFYSGSLRSTRRARDERSQEPSEPD
jgi:class 3 adenylate cyclase